MQQYTLSCSSNAALTFLPQTFEQSQQPAPAAREHILTISETQMPCKPTIQTAQQVANKGQRPISVLVVDDLQDHLSSH